MPSSKEERAFYHGTSVPPSVIAKKGLLPNATVEMGTKEPDLLVTTKGLFLTPSKAHAGFYATEYGSNKGEKNPSGYVYKVNKAKRLKVSPLLKDIEGDRGMWYTKKVHKPESFQKVTKVKAPTETLTLTKNGKKKVVSYDKSPSRYRDEHFKWGRKQSMSPYYYRTVKGKKQRVRKGKR